MGLLGVYTTTGKLVRAEDETGQGSSEFQCNIPWHELLYRHERGEAVYLL
jgi:hypothetical protein